MVEEAIRRAAIALLVADGYAGLTIERVARRAGVGHMSIYRRWPSKADLVHELVFPAEQGFAVPSGTPFDEVVRELARGMLANLSRPEARAAIPGLQVEAQADPELRRRLASRLEPGARAILRRAAAEAAERGEIRAGVDADVVYDAVLGTALAAPFTTRAVGSQALAGTLADLLLDGIRTPQPRTAARRKSKGERAWTSKKR